MRDKKFYPWVVVGLLWVVALLNYTEARGNGCVTSPIPKLMTSDDG